MLTSNLNPTIKSTLTDPYASPNWKFHGARIPDPARNARTKRTQIGNGLKVRGLISSGDRTVESGAPSAMEVKDGNGSLMGSSGSDIQVKAVVSIKKKIRQRLFDKVEDQWFNFCNSIGQGIFIQLISEGIDPGICFFFFFFNSIIYFLYFFGLILWHYYGKKTMFGYKNCKT